MTNATNFEKFNGHGGQPEPLHELILPSEEMIPSWPSQHPAIEGCDQENNPCAMCYILKCIGERSSFTNVVQYLCDPTSGPIIRGVIYCQVYPWSLIQVGGRAFTLPSSAEVMSLTKVGSLQTGDLREDTFAYGSEDLIYFPSRIVHLTTVQLYTQASGTIPPAAVDLSLIKSCSYLAKKYQLMIARSTSDIFPGPSFEDYRENI